MSETSDPLRRAGARQKAANLEQKANGMVSPVQRVAETSKAQRISEARQLERFQKLFDGNPDAYGVCELIGTPEKGKKQKTNSYTRKEPHTEQIWNDHLAGKSGLGIIPIRDDGTVMYGGIDVDVYDLDLLKVIKNIKRRRLPLVPMLSKSGGLHLYLFLSKKKPARDVIKLLKSLAGSLGFPGVEVFPKQTKIGKTGNWLNLPYFADSRQALSDGVPMSFEKFLDHAEAMRTDHLEYEQPFASGPPCLEVLQPFQQNARNTLLFNSAVFLKLKYGDEWKKKLKELNQKLVDIPVTSEELKTIRKSADGGDYQYQCEVEPLASHCNRKLCMTRPHGVAGTRVILMPSADREFRECAIEVSTLMTETGEYFERGGPVMIENGEIEPVDDFALRTVIESLGPVAKLNSKGISVPCRPTLDAARTIRAARVFDLPVLKALSAIPLLNRDGEIIIGFHDGVMCGDLHVPIVPLDVAVRDLKELLRDYQFQSSGDRARALAAFITPLLRMSGLLDGHVPIDVSMADTSQAGKTLRTEIIYRIYHDKPTKVLMKDNTGGVGGFAESLSECLVKARGFIRFDNVRELDSEFLESILTDSGLVPVRCFKRAQGYVDISRMCFQLTANGLHLTQDLANRCSVVRINKQPADYQFHKWKEEGILQHVEANADHYLGCVFAVARHWINAGRPRHEGDRTHDFRVWAESMEWIMRDAFDETGLMKDHTEVQRSIVDPGLVWFRKMVQLITEGNKKVEHVTASGMAEISAEYDNPIPGGEQDYFAVGKILKRLFDGQENMLIDNVRVTLIVKYDSSRGHDLKSYTFEPQKISDGVPPTVDADEFTPNPEF